MDFPSVEDVEELARLLANLRIQAKAVANRVVAPRYGRTSPLYILVSHIQNCYDLATYFERLAEALGPRTLVSKFCHYYTAADPQLLPQECKKCDYERVQRPYGSALRCRVCSMPIPSLRPFPHTPTAKVCRGIQSVLKHGYAFLNKAETTLQILERDSCLPLRILSHRLSKLQDGGGWVHHLDALPKLANELSIYADWVNLSSDDCDDLTYEEASHALARAKLIKSLVTLDPERFSERGYLDKLQLEELQAMWEGHPSLVELNSDSE